MNKYFICCFIKKNIYKNEVTKILTKKNPIDEYFYNQDLEDKYIQLNIIKN